MTQDGDWRMRGDRIDPQITTLIMQAPDTFPANEIDLSNVCPFVFTIHSARLKTKQDCDWPRKDRAQFNHSEFLNKETKQT